MITTTPISLRDFAPSVLGQAVTDALAAQATLTAVDKFSSWHRPSPHEGPELEKWYRDLLPLQAPGPGEQYAFEVDLDRCSGCKACVTACHNLNGLDDEEGESFREVGLLLDPGHARGPQHVTSACHHCLQPGCADGCPVLAYEKEPDTGVVKHLDDQCIGCEYCVLKCPYDVPKYHHGKGIVRKCDLCVGRLRAGEAPACVQACPTKAIRVTVISTAPEASDVGFSLPGAPDPVFTRPTTRFKSKRPLPQAMQPGDALSLKPEAAHEPLVATLVISQAALGMALAQLGARYVLGYGEPAGSAVLSVLPFVVMCLGLLVGLNHLGRPKLAWKAWLNWRRSWLSREVIAFGAFAGASGLAALVSLTALAGTKLQPWADGAVCATALAGLFANAMVYIDTPRAVWRTPATLARFTLTALGTGALIIAAVLMGPVQKQSGQTGMQVLLGIALASQGLKLLLELSILRHLRVTRAGGETMTSEQVQRQRSARLLMGPKRMAFGVRMALGLLVMAGAGILALTLAAGASTPGLGAASLVLQQAAALLAVLALAADCVERHLFFTAAASPRMPGTL